MGPFLAFFYQGIAAEGDQDDRFIFHGDYFLPWILRILRICV
jgi:hypothetical protein